MLCDYCKRKIESGEDYFDLPDATVCEDCIDDYLRDHRYELEEDDDPRYEPEYWEDR